MNLLRYFYAGLALFLFLGFTNHDLPTAATDDLHVASPLVWHDLVTPDLESSRAFYSAVFGWTFRAIEAKGLRLATIYSGDTKIGGAIEVPRANSAVWIKAVAVNDLEERIALVERNGGKVLLPPAVIPGRGTQVIMEGAEGEEFSFIGNADTSLQGMKSSANHLMGWSELWAESPEAAKKFYESAFGVGIEAHEVDERPYWVFGLNGEKLAGMVQNPITNQGTQWVPYVASNDPEGVITVAKDRGAFIVLAPDPEVRDGKVGIFQDPQGAMVCVMKK